MWFFIGLLNHNLNNISFFFHSTKSFVYIHIYARVMKMFWEALCEVWADALNCVGLNMRLWHLTTITIASFYIKYKCVHMKSVQNTDNHWQILFRFLIIIKYLIWISLNILSFNILTIMTIFLIEVKRLVN